MELEKRTLYIKTKSGDTWHFMSGCQHYKRIADLGAADVSSVFSTGKKRPMHGELCNECLGKEKSLE